MRGRDDKIVTTFCEVVTAHDSQANFARAGSVTKEMGEAMAPASESPPSGGNRSGAGAAPIFRQRCVAALGAGMFVLGLLGALGACGDDAAPATPPARSAAPRGGFANPAIGITELDLQAPHFSDAVLDELTGDLEGARASFEMVLSGIAPAPIAARAALHLAQFELRAGKSRHALDLVARAAALAPSDVAITEGVAELQADVVAAAGNGDLRGPRLGILLLGVEPSVAAAFAAAERALAQVHKLRPRPIIEALSTSIRVKEEATEDAVLKYRAVAEHGGLAQIAASYRIGSLYHDLALGLLFELPPELDPAVAAGLRRTLRGRAVAYLKKAVTEYRASLTAPKHPYDELWRLAAETDLRGVRDVLGEAGEKSPF